MSDLKLKGSITKIQDVQEGSSNAGKNWKKLGFVVQTEGDYPKNVHFSVFGEEKVDNFMKYNKVGQNVEVSFNVESREYNDRYYTDLQAWKVFTIKQEEEVALVDDGFHSAKSVGDDLPF